NLQEARPDVAFIALHGRLGEDGTVQGLLEILGIPYTGSGVLASALSLNKVLAKKVWSFEAIPTPKFASYSERQWRDGNDEIRRVAGSFGFPLVVKPVSEGSTLGLSVVKSTDELGSAVNEAFRFDTEIMIEEFIDGKEITVGVVGNHEPLTLPTLEVVTDRPLYDYEAKYTEGLSRHIIPAGISEAGREAAAELALRAHTALGCRGFSRVDLMVGEQERLSVLELNTIPGLTELSLFPDAAKAAGYEFPDLIERIVSLALETPPAQVPKDG
ncbi:MAG: D-alanine--D-alanine ligase, partial [Terriglobia bacterium]